MPPRAPHHAGFALLPRPPACAADAKPPWLGPRRPHGAPISHQASRGHRVGPRSDTRARCSCTSVRRQLARREGPVGRGDRAEARRAGRPVRRRGGGDRRSGAPRLPERRGARRTARARLPGAPVRPSQGRFGDASEVPRRAPSRRRRSTRRTGTPTKRGSPSTRWGPVRSRTTATAAARSPSSSGEASRRARHGRQSGAGEATRASPPGRRQQRPRLSRRRLCGSPRLGSARLGSARTTYLRSELARTTVARPVERSAQSRHGPVTQRPVAWASPRVGGGLGWDQRGAPETREPRTATRPEHLHGYLDEVRRGGGAPRPWDSESRSPAGSLPG